MKLFRLLLLLTPAAALAGEHVNLDGIPLAGLKGEKTSADALPRGALTVFIAGGTHCPILRQYVPTLNQLAKKWKKNNVLFYLVNEAGHDDAKGFRAEYSAFKLNFPAYLDPGQELAKRLGLTVTSKVAVLNAAGDTVYTGAIDDQFSFEGKKPGAPVSYLDENLKALLGGKAPPFAAKSAVGCAITIR